MFNSKIILALLALLLMSISTRSQDNSAKYVYMIRIPESRHHKTVLQTGFRLRDTKGIITALHGVADGTIFSAKNESGDVLNGLRIASIDVERDLALLRSPELEGRAADGLLGARDVTLVPGQTLTSYSHPLGIDIYIREIRTGKPVQKPLYQLIPPNSANIYDRRRSPSTEISVLNIPNSFVPGESGAPILNDAGEVVGVVDGGLLAGAAAISWAIPITAVRWRDVGSGRTLLAALANSDTKDLFQFTEIDESNGTLDRAQSSNPKNADDDSSTRAIESLTRNNSEPTISESTRGIPREPGEEKDTLYKGGPNNESKYRFKLLVVDYNADDDLRNTANKAGNKNGTHVWDNKWYYWSQKKTKDRLLLVWKNLTNHSFGWLLAENVNGTWICKANDGAWASMAQGTVERRTWTDDGQVIVLSLKAPIPTGGWTIRDLQYSFGFGN